MEAPQQLASSWHRVLAGGEEQRKCSLLKAAGRVKKWNGVWEVERKDSRERRHHAARARTAESRERPWLHGQG